MRASVQETATPQKKGTHQWRLRIHRNLLVSRVLLTRKLTRMLLRDMGTTFASSGGMRMRARDVQSDAIVEWGAQQVSRNSHYAPAMREWGLSTQRH